MLRVMSLNLRVHTVVDLWNAWPFRASAVAEMMLRHAPDLIGTQEGLPRMLRTLDAKLQGYARIGQGRQGDDTDEHCVIYYRTATLQLLDHGQFWLSRTPHQPSRDWGAACIRYCTWGQFCFTEHPNVTFRFYNTHLDHVSPPARIQSARVLWETIEAHNEALPLPVLLGGDFNARPNEEVMRFLRGQLAWDGLRPKLCDAAHAVGVNPGRTFHGFRGEKSGSANEPIDYLFTSPEWQVEHFTVDRSKVRGRYPSDHYPLVIQLVPR